MSQLALTHTLVSGTKENVAHAQTNFTDITTWAAGQIDATNITSGAGIYDSYRVLHEASFASFGSAVGGGNIFFGNETLDLVGSPYSATATSIALFDLAAADYAVTGKTTKLNVRALIACNATAPAITFTVGFYPVTVAGGANTLVYTAGTVVAGSTVAFASPSASVTANGTSGDFALPTDGRFALAVVLSGTSAANSALSINAQLRVRNVS